MNTQQPITISQAARDATEAVRQFAYMGGLDRDNAAKVIQLAIDKEKHETNEWWKQLHVQEAIIFIPSVKQRISELEALVLAKDAWKACAMRLAACAFAIGTTAADGASIIRAAADACDEFENLNTSQHQGQPSARA